MARIKIQKHDVPMHQIDQICARAMDEHKGNKQKAYEFCKHTLYHMHLFEDVYERALFNVCNVLKY